MSVPTMSNHLCNTTFQVVYGKKRAMKNQSSYKGHADLLLPAVKDLQALEKAAQTSFLRLATENFSTRKT